MPRIEIKEEAKEEKRKRAGHGRRKKFPMPRIEMKGEVKEEKKEKSGAWERKKVPHAPN